MPALFASPPWLLDHAGRPRRVGVELEMNGLELDTCAQLLARHLGLPLSRPGRYERRLHGEPHGDWIVELDFQWLKKMGRTAHDTDTLTGVLEATAEEAVARLATNLVPLEVISPPLPISDLALLNQLVASLREAGAKGTSDSVVNAFGLQFNPEVPATDAATLTRCLQAFLCLYDWLAPRASTDLLRRVTPYIDPFPRTYILKVLAPGYAPDLTTLIADYLQDNPTRNRALDMLPLFKYLAAAQVEATVSDSRVKARPAFHYRLPDCNIHFAGWGIHAAWNDWVEVERLAADEARLQACCTAYLATLQHPLDRWGDTWAQEVATQWLSAHQDKSPNNKNPDYKPGTGC